MIARFGITTRITLLWVALFAVGLAGFAALAEATVVHEQRESLDNDLSAMATATAQNVGANGSLARVALPSDVPGIALLSYRAGRLEDVRGPRPPGEIVRAATVVRPGAARSVAAGETYRIVAVDASGAPATRIVAVALEVALDRESTGIRNGFALAALPMILIVGIAGWFVARRSLAPIGQMTTVAAEIARSGRLSTRLGLTSRDELGRLSRTFDSMLTQLEASFARERGFIGDVSHELRNAIGAIGAEAELAIARSRDESAYRAALALIALRARRVAATIDDLLLLARADAGIFDATHRADLNEIASGVCAEIGGGSDGIAIAIELCDDPIAVVGSAPLVTRLVENLVANAYRAATTIVRVRVFERAGNGTLVVEDDGPGIPSHERATIFRRFYRGDGASVGSGLGLSIAAGIAANFGGTIAVEASPSGGALFRAELPLARDALQERSPSSPA